MSTREGLSISDLLLDALESEEEFEPHLPGDDAARPALLLREIGGLGRSAPPLSTTQQAGQRTARSASMHTDSPHAFADDVQPELAKCPHCAHENPVTAKFCSSCGHSIAAGPRTETTGPAASVTGTLRSPATLRVALVSINEDGSDGARFDIKLAESVVGRAGDLRFPTDAFLSPKHARITTEGQRLFIEDLYSLNGTYVKLRRETRLTPGDTFLMGRQVLRFEKFEHVVVPKARSSDGTRYMGSPPPGGQFKLVQVGIGGILQNVYCLPEAGAIIGREKGDVIFPRDKFMSGRHAQIFPREDGHYYLVDLQSSNGSWIKIWDRREVTPGDFVFLGQQLFRVEFG